MKIVKMVAPRVAALCLGMLLGGLPTYAATAAGGYAGHEVIAGDFNGDGWMDFIVQAVSDYFTNAEFIADESGNYTKPVATWKGKHLGVDWSANAHKVLTGDFNGDGRDDIFLQGAAGLGSAVLLANPKGRFDRIAEVPPRTLAGLDLSQASHHLLVGDYNGDGRDDLLLQANDRVGRTGVALAGKDGGFRSLASSWQDGALGLHWASAGSTIATGDFNGDGAAALLLRSKVATGAGVVCCRIVRLGKALKPRSVVESWKAHWLGIDWSPAHTRLVVADLNGDGREDLLLQPATPGGDIDVLLAGKDGQFTTINAQWPAAHDGTDWSAESYRIVVEKGVRGKPSQLVIDRKSVV